MPNKQAYEHDNDDNDDLLAETPAYQRSSSYSVIAPSPKNTNNSWCCGFSIFNKNKKDKVESAKLDRLSSLRL